MNPAELIPSQAVPDIDVATADRARFVLRSLLPEI